MPEDPYAAPTRSPFAEVFQNLPTKLDVEIGDFLKLNSDEEARKYDDVFHWWRCEGPNFCHIETLARRVFAIVSSAASERVGSLVSRHVSKLRMSMSPESLTTLLYMKNLKKFEDQI